MAMADRRPLGPEASSHSTPAFNSDGLAPPHRGVMRRSLSGIREPFPENEATGNDSTACSPEASLSPTEMSPTLRSISPDSLMNSGLLGVKNGASCASSRDSTPPAGTHDTLLLGVAEKSGLASSMLKKQKQAARVPIATGISTTIPVTGEKPKPAQQGDASLEDDVLYAIFLILYEKDMEGSGMTVKQICDVLVERHPEMAQLSSKTLNLVSAKLNAYVKRVEKGDSNLKYALSREWADASPKRMVYVYRGLLAKDFHMHVKHAVEAQKPLPAAQKFVPGMGSAFAADSFEAVKHSALLKPRRQTMFDLGVTRHAFSENTNSSNLFVPYSSAPVAANMAQLHADEPTDADAAARDLDKFINDSDFDFDDLEVFNDSDDDMADFSLDVTRRSGKRSKSMSHLTINKKAKFVTAAAAAPRVPRTPCSHNPHAAAAAAALHAAALKAIAAATSGSLGHGSTQKAGSVGARSDSASSANCSPKSKSNWAHVVRSGFLTQDIGAPEDVSLSDLDKLFA
ncbi:hypothetical protein METBIDRAFT_36951 [Metschnikowia bicuspidata var. bicuspidata NRRL YB-4993]|uniref:GDS1 winged helix domain-containing protein n=1 Tax=Metschnikowia bicuspidata var. bicuspidata NRRL YB-4993 TaxID=869754 RepID=A0A1A0HJ18_9ASCO|nr:hypothetical protein METBIDRAFT_36951 [Metschnikowia bicuspidata var. bicuspidata NRRL YB-4993]OBA23996.1 hypothetical protein METBIDRAFT_36951 [Metschnikowia bicuspidata var. bicuspidata NRRL YB-4993]